MAEGLRFAFRGRGGDLRPPRESSPGGGGRTAGRRRSACACSAALLACVATPLPAPASGVLQDAIRAQGVALPVLEPPVRDSVRREWAVRSAALGDSDDVLRAALAQAFGSDAPDAGTATWDHRGAELEARRRRAVSRSGGATEDDLRAALAALRDPHPNVRERGLALSVVLGQLARDGCAAPRGALAPLSSELVSELAVDPLPEVRARLAERLALDEEPAFADVLEQLARDAAREVRTAAWSAWAALAARDPQVLESWLAEWCARSSNADDAASFEGLRELARGGLDTVGWRRVATILEARGRAAAWVALAESQVFAQGGEGRVDHLLVPWFAARSLDPRTRSFLGAATRSGDPALAQAWIVGAQDLLELEPLARAGLVLEGDPLYVSLVEWLGRHGDTWVGSAAREWIEAGVDALGAAQALEVGAKRLSNAEARALLVAVCGPRLSRWPADAAERLFVLAADANERAELVDALAPAARSGDEVALDLVLACVDDRDAHLARIAFRLAAAAPDPGPHLGRLHEVWLELDPTEQVDRIGLLSVDHDPGPFAADLVRVGRADVGLRTRCAERLAAGPWSEDLHVELARWLVEELAAVSEHGDRDAERRAGSLVASLARFAGPRAHGDLVQAIRLVPAADAVGKHAAAALGATPEGRELLVELLALDLGRRTKIECALQLAHPRVSDAEARAMQASWLPVVRANLGRTDPELAARILDASVRADDEDTREALFALALDRDAPSDLAHLALAALAACPDPRGVEVLERGVREDHSHDRRVAAIRALGQSAASVSRARLAALAEDVAEAHASLTSGPPGVREREVRASLLPFPFAVPATDEELTHLRDELDQACARRGIVSPRLSAELLLGPLAGAEDELVERMADVLRAHVEFRYSRELALAGALARTGTLAEALEPLGAYAERLDPELALALAEEARGAGDAASARRLAAIALAGLPDASGGADKALAVADAHALLAQLAATAGDEEGAAFHRARIRRLERDGRLGSRAAAELVGR